MRGPVQQSEWLGGMDTAKEISEPEGEAKCMYAPYFPCAPQVCSHVTHAHMYTIHEEHHYAYTLCMHIGLCACTLTCVLTSAALGPER